MKYDGTCARCGCHLRRGEPAIWNQTARTIRCVECPTAATDVRSIGFDSGIAGGSARAQHGRRTARRDQAIRDRWGDGFAARVVRAVTTEPQSTRAWAIDAAGEEKLAAELAKVDGLRALHDRRVPGTKGNIDHIVVASAGVFVVDAKNHRGMVAINNRGWLIRPDYRLTVDGRDCSVLADKMAWQVEVVTAALSGAPLHPMPPVTPVLCFVAADWPLFGAPDQFRGVRLESPKSLARLLTRQTVLDEDARSTITAQLATALPPKQPGTRRGEHG